VSGKENKKEQQYVRSSTHVGRSIKGKKHSTRAKYKIFG